MGRRNNVSCQISITAAHVVILFRHYIHIHIHITVHLGSNRLILFPNLSSPTDRLTDLPPLPNHPNQKKRFFRKDKANEQSEKRFRTENTKGQPQGDKWNTAPTGNPLFEEYYKAQGIMPEGEWEDFMTAMRCPLPATFRINGNGRFANDLRLKLEADFLSHFTEGAILIDGEEVQPPKPLPWYPSNLGWQFNFSRRVLRKHPLLEALHEFVKHVTDTGMITRQEAVSMVPPLFLEAQPGHMVLDMCAAPGSKTFQLLEAIHGGPGEPTGLVVANDADAKRCNLLTHQLKRMCSPALIIVNHQGQALPKLTNLAVPGDTTNNNASIMYDRILCDVPCSGDGTVRKQPDIWKRWSPANGNGLHALQLTITLKGVELLKVGGRLVYSTCSLNPLEDEAVVAEVLRRTAGALELVDVSTTLTTLKRVAGLKTWKVKDDKGWYSTWEEGKKEGHKLIPSMFPDEESDGFPLERCMRFLPHHQDTGGFFVAVFEKRSELPEGRVLPSRYRRNCIKEKKKKVAGNVGDEGESGNDETEKKEEEKEEKEKEGEDATATAAGNDGDDDRPAAEAVVEGEGQAEGQEIKSTRREDAMPRPTSMPLWATKCTTRRDMDPVVAFSHPETLAELKSFYGMDDTTCHILHGLVCRSNEELPKRLNYLSETAQTLLLCDYRQQLRVVNVGLKMFEKHDDRDGILSCKYRIVQEGLPLMLPFVSKQVFRPTLNEFVEFLMTRGGILPEEAKIHITKNVGIANDDDDDDNAGKVKEGSNNNNQQQVTPFDAGEMSDGDDIKNEGEIAGGGKGTIQTIKRAFFQDESTIEQVKQLLYGCCIAMLRDEDLEKLDLSTGADIEGGLAANAPLAISCWRGRGSIMVQCSKNDSTVVLEKINDAMKKKGLVL